MHFLKKKNQYYVEKLNTRNYWLLYKCWPNILSLNNHKLLVTKYIVAFRWISFYPDCVHKASFFKNMPEWEYLIKINLVFNHDEILFRYYPPIQIDNKVWVCFNFDSLYYQEKVMLQGNYRKGDLLQILFYNKGLLLRVINYYMDANISEIIEITMIILLKKSIQLMLPVVCLWKIFLVSNHFLSHLLDSIN